MKVKNLTDHPVFAFSWDRNFGPGDEILINPGEEKELIGPYLGKMGGGDCFLSLEGSMICHSFPDDKKAFQVKKGLQLHVAKGDRGVSIWHFSEKFGET